MDSWNSQKLLDKCIYDYFVKKGMHETAEAFASEADVANTTHEVVESPEGFLVEWWERFYGVYSSNQAEHVQDPYAEAAQTRNNVAPQVPYVVPAPSPHSDRPAHNISPVVPALSPEILQGQCHPRTPEDEVTSNLRFLQMDRPSRRVPFATGSSYPMEQIANMPQQWEARDERERCGIYFEQTMLMEPVPDPSEEGSSTGSCSEMQQSP